MGRVFFILTTLSLMLALLTNRAPSAASALLNSAESGVSLMLTLLGTMTLWSGLMEVLLRTGDVAKLGLLIRKLFGRHSRALPDADCWEAVGMNLAANVLGLGNAATPPGIEAARRLAARSPGAASDELCRLIDECVSGALDSEVHRTAEMLRDREQENVKGAAALLRLSGD